MLSNQPLLRVQQGGVTQLTPKLVNVWLSWTNIVQITTSQSVLLWVVLVLFSHFRDAQFSVTYSVTTRFRNSSKQTLNCRTVYGTLVVR